MIEGFLSWLFRRPEPTGIASLLGSVGIPTPSTLMAQMVAYRIAQMPPEHRIRDGAMSLRIPIRGGEAEIEVYIDAESSRFHWANNRHYARVRLGMPGPPVYRSVDLSPEEALLIADAAHALHCRTVAVQQAEREAQSQHNALDILEELL